MLVAALIGAALVVGCKGASTDRSEGTNATPAAPATGNLAPATAGGDPDEPASANTDPRSRRPPGAVPSSLLVPPMVAAPTADGATVHAVFDTLANARSARLHVADAPARAPDRLDEGALGAAAFWDVRGLDPAARVPWRLVDRDGERLSDGEIPVAPGPGEPFVAALVADTHVLVRRFDAAELEAHPLPAEAVPGLRDLVAFVDDTLPPIAARIADERPDLVLHLGDAIDSHGFGFNEPVPDPVWLERGWLRYRQLMGDALGASVHLLTIGNWDGENGDFPPEDIADARQVRQRWMPTPVDSAGPAGDYYAVDWGDARFIVLNVMSYTPTPHLLHSGSPGRADDWTLGEDQKAWLEAELDDAVNDGVHWSIIAAHHPVGGKAGDAANAAYGRGGGLAHDVGEQAWLHALMREHGVRLFLYGHDHVFTDVVVDGIHYTLPGRAGAPWAFTTSETGYETYWTEPGYGRLHVSPETLSLEFVRGDDGEVLHAFEIER